MLRFVRDEIEISYAEDRDYIEASELRLLTNKESKNLSLIDCLGYVYAKRRGIKFLTGDREFEYMKNVEYVKYFSKIFDDRVKAVMRRKHSLIHSMIDLRSISFEDELMTKVHAEWAFRKPTGNGVVVGGVGMKML